MGLRSGIRDPVKTYFGSRIQRSKKAPDSGSDPQHCIYFSYFFIFYIERLKKKLEQSSFCDIADLEDE